MFLTSFIPKCLPFWSYVGQYLVFWLFFYHFCSLKTAVRAQMSDFLTANVSGSVPPPHPQEQNFSGVPNVRIMIEKNKGRKQN